MHRLLRPAPLLVALLVGLLAAAVVAAPAFGRAPTTKKAIWGPSTAHAFRLYHQLGAGLYETSLGWHNVAPTRPHHPRDPADPAYDWPSWLDDAVARAKANHMGVVVELTGAPGWANGGHAWNWAPRQPQSFADFAYAAAKRYPGIRRWMIWGEPSRAANFMPLHPEHRRSHHRAPAHMGRRQKVAPHRYARILDASYAALKQARRRNIVIGGNTFTTGDISPYNWIRNLRLPSGRPPRMDMYGHNPFTLRRPAVHKSYLGFGFADFSTLWKLEGWIDRYLHRKGEPRHMKLFLAEFTAPTDHPNHEFNFWVDRGTQASWVRSALKVVRHSRRLATLGWLSLYDEPPRSDHLESDKGLITARGHKKRSFRAYARG